MQELLNQLILFIAIAFSLLVVSDFLATIYTCYRDTIAATPSMKQTPKTLATPSMTQPAKSLAIPDMIEPAIQSQQPADKLVATLDWLLQCIAEEPTDSEEEIPDIIQLAKSRMPSKPSLPVEVMEVANNISNHLLDLSALSIRELKKLASARKIKGYGNMKKSELLQALA